MIKVYSPKNDGELAILKSIFEAENIFYYVLNDHYGTLKVGPKIDLLNAKTIMVPKDQLETANELIEEYLKNIADTGNMERSEYTWKDKIRMIIETVLFSWFLPGRKWNRN